MQFYERHHHHSGSGAENSLRKWRTTVGFGRLFWCVISSSSAGSSPKMPLKCALEWHHVRQRERRKEERVEKKLNEFKIITTTTTIATNNQRSAPKLTQGREKSKVKKGREVTSERANILSCSCSLSLSLARSRFRGWTQNSERSSKKSIRTHTPTLPQNKFTPTKRCALRVVQ